MVMESSLDSHPSHCEQTVALSAARVPGVVHSGRTTSSIDAVVDHALRSWVPPAVTVVNCIGG